MRFGFQVITDGAKVVKVWVEPEPTLGGKPPTVRCVNTGLPDDRNGISLTAKNPFLSYVYQPFVSSLVETKGLSLKVSLQGDPVDRKALINLQQGHLDVSHGSGTLCMAVLDCLDPEKVRELAAIDGEILLTGEYHTATATVRSLIGLDSSERALSNVRTKIKNAIADRCELWILESDAQSAMDQLEGLDRTAVATYIKPFRSRKGTGLRWLIAELEGTYQIPFARPPVATRPVEDRITHDLIRAALPSPDLDGEREKRIATYLGTSTPLSLLKVQKDALDHKEKVFSGTPNGGVRPQHVLIAGPTGCGKTTLMKLVALNGIVERGGGVLYVGPIRAIVDEFHESFIEEYGPLLEPRQVERIYLSSGDISAHDGAITRGNFALANIVNEKANVLLSADDQSRLLEKLTVVIIDELHLLRAPFRGGVLDILLTKLLLEAKRRESRRLQEPGIKALQVIGISTEGIAKELLPYGSLDMGEHDDPRPPLPLFTDERPVRVFHQLAVMFDKPDGQGKKYEVRPIVEFQFNRDREISSDTDPAFETQYRKTFKDATSWHQRVDDRDQYYDGVFLDLVADKSREHATVIAAATGIKKLEQCANSLYNRLTLALDQHNVSQDFEDAVKRAGLTSDRRSALLKWAKRGIFLHHGQFPRVLRRAVEKMFSKNEAANCRHRVLFTTETLAYGVNLSASCVILSSTEWPREDVHDPFAPASDSPTPLSPNEYHNLLGRTGRLGRQEVALNEAIVCVPARRLLTQHDRKEFLSRYYVVAPFGRPASGAVTPPDYLDTMKFHRQRGEYVLNADVELKDFTYPCFRTVMDALRDVSSQEPATTARVMNFLESTVAYQSLDNEGHRKRFGAMVENVLVKAAAHQSSEKPGLQIVIRHEGEESPRYSIGLPGSALIDTGTRLESIEPVSKWLDAMRTRGLTHVPIELVVAGLICTLDFLKTGIELTGEKGAQQPTPEFAAALDQQIGVSLHRELAELQLDAPERDIIVTKLDELGRSSIPMTKAPQLMPTAVKRLLTLILMWLRGASIEDIEIEGKRGYPAPNVSQLQPKHAERLYYLCVMCYRFFDKWDGKFVEGHKAQLPRLALRLKFGLPLKAIPLFNAFSADGLLPREGVTRLSGRIDSALSLLNPNKPAAQEECRRLIDDETLNVGHVDEATAIVRRFYSLQIEALIDLLSAGYQAEPEFLESAAEILQRSFDSASRPLPQEPDPIAELFALEPRCALQRDRANDHLRLFEEEVGNLTITVVRQDGIPNPDVWRLASWFDPPTSARSLTPCAYVLLLSLLERELVSIKDILKGLEDCSGLIGVRSMVEQVMTTPACDSVPRLREGLLELFEPAMV